MRTEAREGNSILGSVFNGGTDRFFYKGTNGRWRDVLADDDLLMYEQSVAKLAPDLRHWLEYGREDREISA